MADPNKLHANHPSIKYAHVRPESKAAAEALLANRGFGHMDVAVALQARDERIKVLEAALVELRDAAVYQCASRASKKVIAEADNRLIAALDTARTALNPTPASTGEQT